MSKRFRTMGFERYRWLVVVVTVMLSARSPWSSVISAQARGAREAFDVISIRENQSGSTASVRPQPLGLIVTNTTALDLIRYAYGVLERDVVGELPGWVRSTRFDVTARTDKGPLTSSRLLVMTKALLEDRFSLDVLLERVEGPVYALVMARSDGKMGPNMRVSEF